MSGIVKRLFAPSDFIRPSLIQGELPPTREAYTTAINLAWPSALEAVLVALIASVDTVMVGGLGPAAISAVGITNQPKYIVLSVIVSLNVGVTAIVARRRGQRDIDGANSCLKQAILLSSALSLFMSVLGILFAREILLFSGAQSDVIDPATTYFRIILVGNFFSSVGLTINAAQRGVGNTRISMRTNLIANLVNLIFNYFLIGGHWIFPRLEVTGAAIATAIGNFVGFLLSIYSISHHGEFLDLYNHTPWKFDRHTIGGMLKISSGAMVEQVFMRIGFFTYAKIVANLGTVAFAAHQICSNILDISYAVGDGFGIAASSLVGQNLGAKRSDLAIVYGKVCQRIGMLVSFLLFLIFCGGRRLFVRIFTPDLQIIQIGSVLMIIIAFSCLAQIPQVILTGCLRGAGDVLFTAVVSLISITLLRPIASWILCYPLGLGLPGAWIGLFLDQMIRFLFAQFRFSSGRWTKIAV